MPRQPVHARRQPFRGDRHALAGLRTALAQLWVFALTAALAFLGIREMYAVLSTTTITVLQWVFLVLFAVNFSWIAFALAQASVGFVSALVPAPLRRREYEGDLPFRTAVLLPTYNERVNLPRMVPQVLDVDPDIQVLVVDDGSPDGTGDIADALAVARPDRVHVLHRKGKGGLGTAYLAGFHWALERDYGWVCEMDADLSHRPEDLRRLMEAARNHPVVVGSRYVDGRVNVVNWPISRLFISIFGSWYARTITRLPVRDATGGFNCFQREVLEAIDLDRVQSNGYAFQIELKLRAWRAGFTPVEIPIIFVERSEGESKVSKRSVREAVWRVWRLRFMDLLGRL